MVHCHVPGRMPLKPPLALGTIDSTDWDIFLNNINDPHADEINDVTDIDLNRLKSVGALLSVL